MLHLIQKGYINSLFLLMRQIPIAKMCIYLYVILSYKATLAFILKGIDLLFQVKLKS